MIEIQLNSDKKFLKIFVQYLTIYLYLFSAYEGDIRNSNTFSENNLIQIEYKRRYATLNEKGIILKYGNFDDLEIQAFG